MSVNFNEDVFSQELKKKINKKPPFLVKYGNVIIFLFMSLILVLTNYCPYTSTVITDVKVTTHNSAYFDIEVLEKRKYFQESDSIFVYRDGKWIQQSIRTVYSPYSISLSTKLDEDERPLINKIKIVKKTSILNLILSDGIKL